MSEPAQAPPVLRLSGITKRFGPLLANDAISLSLGRGEILALLGENGAGKSTLVSILFGHYLPDAGSIEAFGALLPQGDPSAALAAGIGMVHQHFTLADNLSVLDNVMLGTEPLWRPVSGRAAARKRLVSAAERFGLGVDPDARVGNLSVGERQRVEILKALFRDARVLILDEPTAVLTPQESEDLFATLKQLVAQGLSLIFISHKLDEVLRVADRIAVLRGGKLVASLSASETDKPRLAELMVGREVTLPRAHRSTPGALVCELDQVGLGDRLHDVSLALRGGEICAIAGVSGNGQQVLADILCGLVSPDRGEVRLGGNRLPADPAHCVAAGVARIPEDRHAVGVIGDLPVWENVASERYRTRFSRGGFTRRGEARAFATQVLERFDVRAARGIDTTTRSLSGGNMQKLILGRVLGSDALPRLIVANQPTWGLDIGAVAFVHQQIIDACSAGAAVLLVSEELEEIFALAHRIGVMHAGRLTPLRPAAEWTLAAIGLAMTGADTDRTRNAA